MEEQTEVQRVPGTSTLEAGQEQDLKTHNGDKSNLLRSAMCWLSRLIFVIFTIYILYLSFGDYQFFSWHPACLTIGSLLFMAEAVMVMSPDSTLGSKLGHQGKVRLHWILQAGAAGFIFAGFLIIVINKNLHNKNHFESWHAIIGLIFFISVGITSSGGVVTLYSFRLKKLIRPAKMKLLHNLFGILTFTIGVAAEILGLYRHWFLSHSTHTIQLVCSILIGLAAILSITGALRSAYLRFKALYQSI